MIKPKRLLTTLIAITPLVMLFWYNLRHNPSSESDSTNTPENSPDFYLVDAVIDEFDETGRWTERLTASNVAHYPNNDITLLQAPILYQYGIDGELTTVSSLSGRLLSDNTVLELKDQVELLQVDREGARKLQANSDFVTVYTDRKQVSTEHPVEVFDDLNRIEAVGMDAWYERGIIQFKSRVNSLHVPK